MKIRISKRCAPVLPGDEIVYSANKYRETDGIKVRCTCFQYGVRQFVWRVSESALSI